MNRLDLQLYLANKDIYIKVFVYAVRKFKAASLFYKSLVEYS